MYNRKDTWKYCKLGYQDAQNLKLTEVTNWTPLLVYIHVSRIIVGFIFGTGFGICLTILFKMLFV